MIVVVAVTAGVIGAGGGTVYAFAQDGPAPHFAESAQDGAIISDTPEEKSDWPTNASGQTYGSSQYAKSFFDRPDLIEAISQDGTYGYVRRDELDMATGAPGIAYNTPEEGLAWHEQRAAQRAAGQVISISLYEQDGNTVIGSFEIPEPRSN